jgi:hypothetical protein
MKSSLIQILIMICICSSLSAQMISPQVINATGNTSATSAIKLSWSLGEIAVATFSANNTILTQGFLQPDVSVHTSGIEEIKLSDLITIFPNPVHDQLFIRQSSNLIETVSIYNAMGQQIIEQKFLNPELDLSQLLPGIYFINLICYDRNEVHTFKIIKY